MAVEANTIELEASNEAVLTDNQSDNNKVLNVFTSMAEKHDFPKDIIEIFVNHINSDGFDSVDEMIEEINEHPILRHLMNKRKIA